MTSVPSEESKIPSSDISDLSDLHAAAMAEVPTAGRTASPETTEMPRLGRYMILREIARSNDIVYEGADPTMNRRVAIKELNLPPSVSDATRQQRIERFYREARAAGAMNHPAIVTIHEVGEDRGRYYIAMEFLEGQTLRKRMATQGKLSQTEVAQIGMALCEALEYAHERGVVHRDIKPDNVFVGDTPAGSSNRGRVKLTDFGIARITHEETLTATGQFFGTPSYMSPEQLSGRGGVDARSDLFSLGIMLWEMSVGRKPFTGESVPATMFRILNDPTPTSPDISPEMMEVIQRATAKNPAHRYQSASEMCQALAPLARTSAANVTASGPRPSSQATLESGHVLAIEVNDFDLVPANLKPRLLGGLQTVAKATEEAKRALAQNKLLFRSTPGGILVAFFTGDPLAPVRCAVEIDRTFRQTIEPLAQQVNMPLRLRMGIGSGGVLKTDDPSEDVTGEGVAVTRRALRLADSSNGSGIVVTAGVASEALKTPSWSKHLTDLSFRDAGDGMRLHVYNLHGVDFGSVTSLPALGDNNGRNGGERVRRSMPQLSGGAKTALILVPLFALGGLFAYKNRTAVAAWGAQSAASLRRAFQPNPTPHATTGGNGKSGSGKGGSSGGGQKSSGKGGHSGNSSSEAAGASGDPFSSNHSSAPTVEKVAVPKLTGLTVDEARNRLDERNLSAPDADMRASTTVPENQVMGQSPSPGSRVPVGSTVHLIVSSGPDTSNDAAGTQPVTNDTPTPEPSENAGGGAADGGNGGNGNGGGTQ